MTKKKKRIAYGATAIVLFVVELLIALFVHDDFVRPYVGDVLVVVLIYTFVRVFIPEGVRLLSLYVFLFAAGVEILQYFRIAEVLGLSEHRILSVVIGSVFDWKDIVCYGVGCILLYILSYTNRVGHWRRRKCLDGKRDEVL